MEIEGKVAAITGAAAGIGRASATTLARRGAAIVFLADRDEAGLRDTAALVGDAGARPEVVVTDVADVAAQRELFAAIDADSSGLDILHNNAGVGTGEPQFPDMAVERIALIADVNLKGVMLGTRLGVELMAKSGGGVIVNTSSIAADVVVAAEAVYGATKAGVSFFTRCVAGLADSLGVRCNAVCPGVVDTRMVHDLTWMKPLLDGVKLLSPIDIANVVVELIEDDAKNGEVVTVMNEMEQSA